MHANWFLPKVFHYFCCICTIFSYVHLAIIITFIIYDEINCLLFCLFSLTSSNLFMLWRISFLWCIIFEICLMLLFLSTIFYFSRIIFFNFIFLMIKFYIISGLLNGCLLLILWFISYSLHLIRWCFNSKIIFANSDSSNFILLFWLEVKKAHFLR